MPGTVNRITGCLQRVTNDRVVDLIRSNVGSFECNFRSYCAQVDCRNVF